MADPIHFIADVGVLTLLGLLGGRPPRASRAAPSAAPGGATAAGPTRGAARSVQPGSSSAPPREPASPADFESLPVDGSAARRGALVLIEQVRSVVRNGLPFSALESIWRRTALPQREVVAVLGIPERTLARRKAEGQFTAAESDRLYRLARSVAQAEAVLGDVEKARRWLTTPNRALGGEVPLTLLDTDPGSRQVEDVLERIAYGVHG